MDPLPLEAKLVEPVTLDYAPIVESTPMDRARSTRRALADHLHLHQGKYLLLVTAQVALHAIYNSFYGAANYVPPLANTSNYVPPETMREILSSIGGC